MGIPTFFILSTSQIKEYHTYQYQQQINRLTLEILFLKHHRTEKERQLSLETKTVIDAVKHNDTLTLMEKIRLAGAQGHKIIAHHLNTEEYVPDMEIYEDNYYTILSRTFSIMNHALAKASAERFNPDILVKMPFDAFDQISDYARAREISEAGRELMKAALDRYETKNN